MKVFRNLWLVALFCVVATGAMAQSGGGKGPGPGTGMGPALAASAPGKGQHHGAGRWGSDFTPGWSLMTPEERKEHRERMRSMQSHDDCKKYQEQHHEQMAARAKERGGKALAAPRRDGCEGMKR